LKFWSQSERTNGSGVIFTLSRLSMYQQRALLCYIHLRTSNLGLLQN